MAFWSADGEMDVLRKELGNVLTLPEQLYGSNYLVLRHEASGVAICFNAKDALKVSLDLNLVNQDQKRPFE